MRQDAVMQQVFRAVNSWLAADDASRVRQLHLRTYKVVPLSPQAGVLEWCANTTPLATWLVGSGGARDLTGAHARYRPTEMAHREARRLMSEAASTSPPDYRRIRKQYDAVTEAFTPVMR